MRLDKFLWNLWIIARSDVGQWAKKWHITINQIPTRKPQEQVSSGDIINIHHGEIVQNIIVCDNNTIILHKPLGYVSSNVEDGWHPSYRDLLHNYPYVKLLNPAGRLDVDTTGLLLCTSNNQLMHRVIHPNRKVGKTYLITSMLELTDDELDQLRRGVQIEEKWWHITTKEAIITRIDTHHVILTIFEWRYHQIKKMLMSINNKVVWLHRAAIWWLMLDWIGEWKLQELNEDQIDSIFTADYQQIHQTLLTSI